MLFTKLVYFWVYVPPKVSHKKCFPKCLYICVYLYIFCQDVSKSDNIMNFFVNKC